MDEEGRCVESFQPVRCQSGHILTRSEYHLCEARREVAGMNQRGFHFRGIHLLIPAQSFS